jgi:CheY-like chemotaxis protein
MAALEQLDEQITTIAIIDDNPHDSRLIRRLLQSYKHYRVFEAHNGPSGLDLARQRQPDLIILDLTLPGMDGFSILGELKGDERTRAIPVVIISAKSLNPDEWKYLRDHTESIWQKGNFSARDLVNYVVGILGGEEKTTSLPLEPRPHFDRSLVDFGEVERPRILVVDDNVWDARLMRRLFEASHRFEVLEVHSGEEALAVVEQTTPNLIILDLVLPDTHGVTLLEKLRARDKTQDVPVIVISAKDIDPATRSQLAVQADSIWTKSSLDRSSLLAHVETILAE